jgi:hypothetical protein
LQAKLHDLGFEIAGDTPEHFAGWIKTELVKWGKGGQGLGREGPKACKRRMTIASISAIALNLPFEIGGPKPQFAGKPRHMEMLLVRVETSEGIVGWGEAFGYAVWPATRAALDTLIAPLAVGLDEKTFLA